MNKKVIIIGAGGHAKVIADIVLKSNDILVGFLDDHLEKGTHILGYEVLGDSSCAHLYQDCYFIIGIGSNKVRYTLSKQLDVKWYTAIHPKATIAIDVHIGEGSAVMANAVINTSAHIGKHCIINTGAIIEHDNMISDYVHVSVGAKLAGTVYVGKYTRIGIGAVVSNNLKICENCDIRAGAVVIKNLIKSGNYQGIPAKIKE